MYHCSETGLTLIKHFELYVAQPYLCPAGVWTIGYGSTRWLDGFPVSSQTPLCSLNVALALLRRDLLISIDALGRLCKVELSQSQVDCLCSFVYNVGIGAFQHSTLLMKLNRKEYDQVPAELLRWDKIHGVPNRGLHNRRVAEIQLWNSRY